MKKILLLSLIATTLLSACCGRECSDRIDAKNLNEARARCKSFGFKDNTDTMAQCVMNNGYPQSGGDSNRPTYCNTIGYGNNRTTTCF